MYLTPQQGTFQGLKGNFTPPDPFQRPMSRFGGILKCSVRMGFSHSGEPEAVDEYRLTGRLENVHNVNQLTQAVQDLWTAKRADRLRQQTANPPRFLYGRWVGEALPAHSQISPTAKRNRP